MKILNCPHCAFIKEVNDDNVLNLCPACLTELIIENKTEIKDPEFK